MKRSAIENNDGFTLVELIASLVLAGILAIALTTIIITAIDGFFLSQEAAEISHKAQLTLARMRTELLNVSDISNAAGDSIVFENTHGIYEIEISGGLITLERKSPDAIAPKPLTNGIETGFYSGGIHLFTYEKAGSLPWSVSDQLSELFAITITLKFSDNPHVFRTTVNPRTHALRNAPRLVYHHCSGSLTQHA